MVRRLPLGSAALALRRRAAARLDDLRPRRPPLAAREDVTRLSRAPEAEAIVTGNGFASRCRYVLNYDQPIVNERVENDWWFCHGDLLEFFFRELAPSDPFVLFSHNSVRPIGRRFAKELRRPELVAWFAFNPTVRHPKLRALPAGIANPWWGEADQEALREARAVAVKAQLVDLGTAYSGDDEISGLACACFAVSRGTRELDTHRTWKALYLSTVPIVVPSLAIEHHSDFPFVVVDEWEQVESLELDRDAYERAIEGWDPDALLLDRYIGRVERIVAGLRGSRSAEAQR